MSVSIIRNYSLQSHILVGDFKDEHAQFREQILRPAEYAHFHSRLYTGPGWTIKKEHLQELADALKRFNISFAEEVFDDNIRKEKNREKWRTAYRKRQAKKKENRTGSPQMHV